MRRLIVSMNITLDGFMSGLDCGLDWHFTAWNEEMAEAAAAELHRADTIILGRVTYCAMAGYWPLQARSLACAREDIAFAEMMNTHAKVVFSKTLQQPEWNNTRLVRTSIAAEMAKLKRQPGRDMIVYGSGKIVAVLMRLNLVDEYQLWVHPVILGKGKPFFSGLKARSDMRLAGITAFGSGVVLMRYGVG